MNTHPAAMSAGLGEVKKRMFPRKFRRSWTAAAVTAAATVVCSGLTQTAEAAPAGTYSTASCLRSFKFAHTQIQVDNCPSDGAASWVWHWIDPNAGLTYVEYKYTFEDGSKTTIDINPSNPGSLTGEFNKRVRSFNICEHWNVGWFPPFPIGSSCSVEQWLL